jgi:hypothetical protein
MSQDVIADAPFTGQAEFDRAIRRHEAFLAQRGETIVGSGAFHNDKMDISIHTDFGPKDQDKAANQDYVLAWRPRDADKGDPLRLALAMGDGLTTSFRSECAAALACWAALGNLVESAACSTSTREPKVLAEHAFNESGSAIGRIADELARDPQASCPASQFLSTWKYILKKGALFQTTLTLVWLDRECLRIAMIGDGGSLWRGYHQSLLRHKHVDRVLAQCDLGNDQVYALGPADRRVQQFDCWREEKLGGPFLCALHTDGVGRGLGIAPLVLLDELEKLQTGRGDNVSRKYIQRVIEQRPHDFADNLTLAVIQGG